MHVQKKINTDSARALFLNSTCHMINTKSRRPSGRPSLILKVLIRHRKTSRHTAVAFKFAFKFQRLWLRLIATVDLNLTARL